MLIERNKKPKVYFSDVQRKWSTVQAESAAELIGGLSRHDDADAERDARRAI